MPRRLTVSSVLWACLSGAPAQAASDTVVIQEVDAAVLSSDREWIELYNRSSAPVALGGWTIRDTTGAKVIPAFTLVAGCSVVLVASRTAFLSSYPGYARPILELGYPILGNTLDDVGDSIFLADPTATDVDCMSYSNSTSCFSPSTPLAPSTNASNSRNGAGTDTDSAADWSVQVPSPGLPCVTPAGVFPYSNTR